MRCYVRWPPRRSGDTICPAMRDLFLLDPQLVFLNHGSFGACPAEVFAEYQRFQRELERNPVEFLGRRSAGLLLEARTALARYLGTSADRLVFVPNTRGRRGAHHRPRVRGL